MKAAASMMSALLLVTVSCASTERPAPASSAAAAEAPAAVPGVGGFELAAGVVVEPSRAVYLARPEGGIEALEEETGTPSWTSDEAARPLFVQGGRLLALREGGSGLSLAVLDTTDGVSLLELDVPLPEGVLALVDESLQARFTLRPRAVDGAVVLEWEYLERDVLGVSPPRGRPFARRELGAVRVDLESGVAAAIDRADLPPQEGVLPPSVQNLVAAGELRSPLWRTGDLLAAAQRVYEPSERLVLRRWRAESGEALPDVTLTEGRAVAMLPAADRGHLLVVTRLAEPNVEQEYLWSLHSLATGDLVAERRAERSATPFCLLRNQLLFLEPPSARRVGEEWRERPLRLRSLDPETGAELWQRAVRDPALRDSLPPGS